MAEPWTEDDDDLDYTFTELSFVKLYGEQLTRSSLMECAVATRWCFVQMLSLADAKGQFRCATVQSLARTCNVTLAEAKHAIKELEAPDPFSTSEVEEGRRIMRIPGGWKIVNASKYRNMRTKKQLADAERQQRHRDKLKMEQEKRDENVTNNDDGVTERDDALRPLRVTHVTADLDLELRDLSLKGVAITQDQATPYSEISNSSESSQTKQQRARKSAHDESRRGTLAKEVASAYLASFNAAHRRKFVATDPPPALVESVAKRMKDGYQRDHIVAIPILTSALGTDARRFSALVFLRDGKHGRTSNGRTTGAYDWMGETFGKIDTIRLSEDQASIAQHFGVMDLLTKLGVQVR